MAEPIISRERIESQARSAARMYSNVNDACPYPWATDAARLFKAEFSRARIELEAGDSSSRTDTPTPPHKAIT